METGGFPLNSASDWWVYCLSKYHLICYHKIRQNTLELFLGDAFFLRSAKKNKGNERGVSKHVVKLWQKNKILCWIRVLEQV